MIHSLHSANKIIKNNMLKKDKKGFEFSFGWIFAIIVGAVVIFLAIYASSKFVFTERRVQDTETAKELGIILSPLETGLEESKKTIIAMPGETRIYNRCVSSGNFGSQKISVASRSGIGKEWQNPGVESTFYNKYLFSSAVSEGQDFYFFTKSFNMPFKIGDLIFMISENEKYCFVKPPREIEDEINDLDLRSVVNLTNFVKECGKGMISVCFASVGCDVDVNIQSKSVKKTGKTVYYEDSLVYGAIFSDPIIYECQTQRLMKRASELGLVYLAKSEYVAASSNGCSSNMQGLLISYSNKTAVSDSAGLKDIYLISQELEDRNEAIVSCKIF